MSNRAWVVPMLLAAVLSGGCGTAADSGTSGSPSASSRPSRPDRPGLCQVGKSVLPAVPDAPALWREGRGDPIALACLPAGGAGGAVLVGFPLGEGSCVVSYDFRRQETLDERCTEPGTSWTIQCEGTLGCTSAFAHEPGSTRLDGPVDAKVRGVEVRVGGKPLVEGTMFAAVKGGLMRAIGAREPFGFFFVTVPRCVSPAAVRVGLRGAGGSDLGTAQGWDVVVESCRNQARQRSAPG